MEPKGYLPYYDDIKFIAEIDIRGRFISMACDIEWTLLHIMMRCVPDPMNQLRKFNSEDMQMHNKIECTICDLKKYKPDIYKIYKDELEKLWEFKQIRNDLAHLKMQYDKDDLKSFKLWLIQEGPNGKEQLHYKLYTIDYLKDRITEFRKLNVTLAGLVELLDKDIKSRGK